VRRSAVDEAVSKADFELRQKYYEIQRQIVDTLIMDEVYEKEAKARGTTREALIKAEVDDKVAPVTPDDVHALYEQQKGQMGGRSEDQIRPQIEAYLRTQRSTERRDAFETELRKKNKVEIKLDPPRQAVEIPADAPILGPETAPVTIVEYTDYQCPYCQKAQTTVDEVVSQFGAKVRLVARDYPLEFHSRALYASRASHCAGDQKKFWEYHQDLLRRPSDLQDNDLEHRASTLGLDESTFKTCLASDRHDKEIHSSQDSGNKVGVRGTPAFFVNGRFLNGAVPKQQFVQIIEDELTRAASR